MFCIQLQSEDHCSSIRLPQEFGKVALTRATAVARASTVLFPCPRGASGLEHIKNEEAEIMPNFETP